MQQRNENLANNKMKKKHQIKEQKCSLKINSQLLPWLIKSFSHTHTVTHKPDHCGSPLTPEGALSRLVAAGALFSSLSTLTSNSICASNPFSYTPWPLPRLRAGPRRVIRITYPFIVQDTHLAKQGPFRGTCQRGYISMWQPFASLIFFFFFFDANSCVIASAKVALLNPTCSSFSVWAAHADSVFTLKTVLHSFEKPYSSRKSSFSFCLTISLINQRFS